MSDERITRRESTRSQSDSRGSDPRVEQTNQREAGHVSIEERIQAFRNEFLHTALPRVPEKNGWHHCWLSTTNQYDPIQRRIRMGYVLVRAEEISEYPELMAYSQKSGAHEGYIACNEMLLSKIPYDLYAAYMKEMHETAPDSQGEALRQQIRSLNGNSALMGQQVERDMGDGTAELLKRPSTRRNTAW